MAKITVTGLAQWAKVFEENRDLLGYQGQWAETDGRCSIEMVLDEENAKRITASGCMSKGKPDPEGRGNIFKFNRKFSTPNDWDGDATYTTRLERVKIINLVEYSAGAGGANDPFTADVSSSDAPVIAAQSLGTAVDTYDDIPF